MSAANAWHLPLIAVGVGFHLAVSWALLWRYFQARERSLITWALAWLILSVHVLGMFLTRVGIETTAPLVRDLSYAAASIALYAGQAEREGRQVRPPISALAGASVLVGLATLAGAWLGEPVTLASAAVVILSMSGAAWFASPAGTGRKDVSRWLLFSGYIMAALHALDYAVSGHGNHSVVVEILGHAMFSLLFSAAVTWQAWEHEQAVRLFSKTLQRLNRPLSTQEAMNEALKTMAETLHVTEGWILLRESGRGDTTGKWVIGAALGFPNWSLHGLENPAFAIEQCLCMRPVDPESLVTSIRDLPCVRFSAQKRRPAGRHVLIPLGADGQVQGIMSLLLPGEGEDILPDREGRVVCGSTEDEPNLVYRASDSGLIRLLTALGEQIGLALDRARLYDELKAKEQARGRLLAQLITAQEDERRRIARELHDETGQALTALVVNLDFLVRHPGMDPQATKGRLSAVRDMAESTLAEVRRVIHEMRPSVLDDLGLEAAVRWLMRRYEPSGFHVDLEFKGINGRLPGPTETTVFRLIQEACTNTVKHAGAKSVSVRVTRNGDRIAVEIADEGVGMDLSQLNAAGGMGLAGFRERVALMGGTLTIGSAPGAGTRIHAELPIGEAIDNGDSSPDLRRSHDGAAGSPHGVAVRARH